MDNLTAAQRKKTMASVRSKNTKPEMIVRRMVHAMGYRYRLHRRDLPGNPDMVFPRFQKVIFIHGCFWHGHNCKSGKNRPQSNQSYWNVKLERNKTRDKRNLQTLKKMGWRTLIVWECQIKDASAVRAKIVKFLGDGENGE